MWKVSNLSLSSQVNLTFAILSAILLAVGALVFFAVGPAERHITSFTSRILIKLELIDDISRDAGLVELEVLRHLLTDDAQEKQRAEEKIAATVRLNQERLVEYQNRIDTQQERQMLDEVLAARKAYTEVRERFLAISRNNRADQAMVFSHDVQLPAFNRYQQALNKLGEFVEQETQASGAAISHFISRARTTSTVLIGVGLAIGAGMGFVVVGLSRRLKQEEQSLKNEVAERKRAEMALQESFRQLQEQSRLLDRAHVFARNMKDEIIYWNAAAEKRYGWPHAQAMGKVTHQLFKTQFPEPLQDIEAKLLRDGHWEGELIHTKRDGSQMVIASSWELQADETHGPLAILEVCTDITARKRAEEELVAAQQHLRHLAAKLLSSEENERRRIASEIHDHIGQTLAGCKLKLVELRETLRDDPRSQAVEDIYQLIQQTIRDSRLLTFELSPPILHELGLEAALFRLCETTQQNHGPRVLFRDDARPKPLNEDVRVLLFRAARELLINVAKHAKANEAMVTVERDSDLIKICVSDDGLGFDTSLASPQSGRLTGFGLFSIRDRLKYLGGRMELESKLGAGTRVVLVAPLRAEAEGMERNAV